MNDLESKAIVQMMGYRYGRNIPHSSTVLYPVTVTGSLLFFL